MILLDERLRDIPFQLFEILLLVMIFSDGPTIYMPSRLFNDMIFFVIMLFDEERKETPLFPFEETVLLVMVMSEESLTRIPLNLFEDRVLLAM